MRSDYTAFCPKCYRYTQWCEYHIYPDTLGAKAYCKNCGTKFDAGGFGGDGTVRYYDGENYYTSGEIACIQGEYEYARKQQRETKSKSNTSSSSSNSNSQSSNKDNWWKSDNTKWWN